MNMRMTARAGLVALAVVTVCGCGGKSSSPTSPGCGVAESCSVTLAGAVTGTLTCASFVGTYGSGTGTVGPSGLLSGAATINSASQQVTVLIDIAFAGDLHTGTFTNTDASAHGDVILQGPGGDLGATWETLAPSTGSYTMNITCTGTSSSIASGTAYANVHGTLTATLPAAGHGATGVVTLTATF